MIQKCILDQDPRIEIEPEDFSEEADSKILDRKRVRGTKLEKVLQKGKRSNCGRVNPYDYIPPKDWQTSTVLKKRSGNKCK